MKSSTLRSEYNKDETFKPINISVSVVGLSGNCQLKGTVGVGKSSLCNRLVRPDQYSQKQISTLSQVDFHSDIINGSSWIYWNYVLQTIDSKVYAFHVIEQTVLISDQTFLPFDNDTESDYINRAVADRVIGTKRAYLSPAQFSRSQRYDTLSSSTEQQSTIDAFILVFDVSEVNSRDYQAQDRYVTKLLTTLHKARKPIVIVLSKFDIKSAKIKSRFDSLMEKQNLKGIPIIETSANLNVNISSIPLIVISEIQNHHRSIPLSLGKKYLNKVQTFEEALLAQMKLKEDCFMRFQQLVSGEVKKFYDLSWDQFVSNNDLSGFLGVADKCELVSEFGKCRTVVISQINESLMSIYLVLFKKTLMEFIQPILTDEDSSSQSVQLIILQSPKFLQYFHEEDIDESNIFKSAHLINKIDYPLPRFLININSPRNKLQLIEVCIKEIKCQRIDQNFNDEFLKRLESNAELYEDMSFVEIENHMKDMLMSRHFKELAAVIFSSFVDNRISQFKRLFDEKLLELSFMIFMCAPVKTCMKKCTIKEKDYKETIPDMGLINSINNKIYFDHKKFEKKIYLKQRTNWVVKYIGSLVSSNPRECYHFDFNSAICHNNLLEYLRPFKVQERNIVVVISFDKTIDQIWNILSEDKSIITGENFSSTIEFISSNKLSNENLWTRKFHPCQKLVILFTQSQSNGDEVVTRMLYKCSNYPDQLSFIDVESCPSVSDLEPLNLAVTRVKDHCNNTETVNFIDNSVMNVIKEQTISYICQRESISIWFIVLCDDKYDCNIPVTFFLSLFDDCIVLERHIDDTLASVSLVYVPLGDAIPQRINVTILSYHQAFKLLNDKCQDCTVHLLTYFCDLNRLASINTLFAVLNNLLTVGHVKSIICSIKSAVFLDNDEFLNKRKMVKELAIDKGVLCVIIEYDQTMQRWFSRDIQEIQLFQSAINECLNLVNDVDDRNLCKFNTAYETEDMITGSRLSNGHGCQEHYKSSSVKCCNDDVACHHSSFGSQERTFSQSDSPISPEMTFLDRFFGQDTVDCGHSFSKIELVDSAPLGCYHEHMFCPIEEENSFPDEIQDTSTYIQINCTNIRHIGNDDQLKSVANNHPSSKFRSFSGPVQVNKSFSRNYPIAQNTFNYSQRYSTKKSKSLTTSPVTSYMKCLSHNQIICTHCKGSNDHCLLCPTTVTATTIQNTNNSTPKGFRNAICRLFSSDRCSNKSAEERRGIFRRSMKFPKKNSDKKVKNMPTMVASSDGLFSRYTNTFLPPPAPHSTSVPISDIRSRTKSLSKTVSPM